MKVVFVMLSIVVEQLAAAQWYFRLMLLGCDGFDLCTFDRARLKYSRYATNFDQDTIITGRDGEGDAFVIINTGFGFADYFQGISPGAATIGFHADVQIAKLGTGASFQQCDFYRFSGGGQALLVLRILTSGHLQLIDGVLGTVLDTTAAAIALDTWYTLECVASFGGPGSAVVRLDGLQVLAGAGFGNGSSCDTFGFRWQVFGPPSLVLDNYVWYDGTAGDRFDTFTGRLRVTSLRVNRDAAARWAPTPGPAVYTMVDDDTATAGGSPDGDLTYITRAGTTQAQIFELEPSPCFGKVYGLAINACFRPDGIFTPLDLLVQPLATQYTLGSLTPAVTAYRTLQAVAGLNPETSDDWTDAEISGSYWGLKASAGTPRVTAFYVEKITSLVAQPYSCGNGSYSY